MIFWVLLVYFLFASTHKDRVHALNDVLEEGTINRISLGYALLIFGYFIFWIGIRKGIGDTSQYILTFESFPTDFSEFFKNFSWSDSKAPFFEIFEAFFKSYISNDVTIFLLVIAIISGISVMATIRNYSVDFFYSSFLFITLINFMWMMDGMRQFICVALLFACCPLIIKGKTFKFIICVLLISTVHLTALLMIPFYFVAKSPPWKYRTFIFVIIVLMITIFSDSFFSGVDYVLSDTAYADATSQFAADNGVNPLRALFSFIPPFLALLNRKKLSVYYDKYKILPICINMSLVTASLYLIGVFTSGILIGRTPIYTEVYNLILIPFLLESCFSESSKKYIKWIYGIVSFIYFYLLCDGISYYSDLTGWV